MDQEPDTSSHYRTRSVLHRFDWTANESTSAAVVRAIDAVSDEEPGDLPPLYDAIDPDALDAIFAHEPISAARQKTDVTFPFDAYLVRITSEGTGYVFQRELESDG